MKPIQNPPPPELGQNSSAEAIVNLQGALLFLIEKQVILWPDEERRIKEDELRQDCAQRVYGAGTSNVVTDFRHQFGLKDGELADEAAVNFLNAGLRRTWCN